MDAMNCRNGWMHKFDAIGAMDAMGGCHEWMVAMNGCNGCIGCDAWKDAMNRCNVCHGCHGWMPWIIRSKIGRLFLSTQPQNQTAAIPLTPNY